MVSKINDYLSESAAVGFTPYDLSVQPLWDGVANLRLYFANAPDRIYHLISGLLLLIPMVNLTVVFACRFFNKDLPKEIPTEPEPFLFCSFPELPEPIIELPVVPKPITAIHDFVACFLHPYITGFITPENDPKDRPSLMDQLMEELQKKGNTTLYDEVQQIALEAYLEIAAFGLCLPHYRLLREKSSHLNILTAAFENCRAREFPKLEIDQGILLIKLANASKNAIGEYSLFKLKLNEINKSLDQGQLKNKQGVYRLWQQQGFMQG